MGNNQPESSQDTVYESPRADDPDNIDHLAIKSSRSSGEDTPEHDRKEPVFADVIDEDPPYLDSMELDDTSLLVRIVFSTHLDVAQNFRLYKWILNREHAEAIIQSISGKCETVNVIGVYGSTQQSLKLIQQLIQSREELKISSKEEKEGIIAYCRPDLRLICFFYKISKEEIYETKPYPSSSREAIYVRLLFDLCPVVVCCISDSLLQHWYSSSDPQKKNPFLPKIHPDMIVRVGMRKIESSEVEEVKVKQCLGDNEKLHLTTDHHPFMFSTYIYKKNLTKSTQDALDKLRKWLAERKEIIIQYPTEYNDFTKSNYFDTPKYQAVKAALKRINEDTSGINHMFQDKFTKMRSQVIEISKIIYEEFYKQLFDKYKFKEIYKRWWISWNHDILLADIVERLKEKLVMRVDYSKEESLIEDLVQLLSGFKESIGDSKSAAQKSFKTFFIAQLNLMKAKRESFIEEKYHELDIELSQLIQMHAHSQAMEYCMMKTYSFTLDGDQIVMQSKGIENKISSSLLFGHEKIHILEKEVGFVTFESEGRFQTFKFNPQSQLAYETEELSLPQSDFLIASGSTANLFVLFSNGKKEAYRGAAQEMKGIGQGIGLKVYSERVNRVISACILQKTKRILLLNETGTVFMIELSSSDSHIFPVIVDKRVPRTSPEGQSLEPEVIREPLRPTHGSRFYDIKASGDETLYFILTDAAIEVFDLNFILNKTIPVESPDIAFKVLSSETHNIVIILAGRELKAYRFQSQSERLESTVEESNQVVVDGNPVIDILYHALFKFGSQAHFMETKPALYLYSNKREVNCERYFASISYLSQNILFRGSVTPSTLNLIKDELESRSCELKAEDLQWRLFTRSPLHLCSIQEGNMVPLQNGFNNFEGFINELSQTKNEFISSFIDYIRLGCLEPIIQSAENIKVISIIGKQSSGKSYLLNRLFGTRFDVAAHRCTDGIWISVTKVQDQTFFILDCEGLFSAERSVQEEIKLCLLLAAISDVTILNQDLTFNRNLTFLFEKFTYGIDRLKGSQLFKGRLEIAIRDVAVNQGEGANTEVRKFVDNTVNQKKADFLIKLFGGVFMCCSYHNFENEALFELAVASRRQFYLDKIPSRWTSGKDFLIILKTIIAQIYADDSQSIDSRTFQLKLNGIISTLKKAIEDPDSLKETVEPENPPIKHTMQVAGSSYSFSIALFDVKVSLSRCYKAFDEFLENHVPVDLRRSHHNEWYQGLEIFMNNYFGIYKEVVIGFLEKSISVNDEMRPIFEGGQNILEKIIENTIVLKHTLCRRKCQECGLSCIRPQRHQEICDCSTDHKCIGKCSICPTFEMCAQQAGHAGDHYCTNKKHTCGNPCDISPCKGKCICAPNHMDAHRCSESFHPCGARCELFSTCKRICLIDKTIEHDIHNCKQSNCPFPCILCEGSSNSTCASQDHLHSLSKSPDSMRDHTGKIIHLCNKTHGCTKQCNKHGVCSREIHSEPRTWVSEFSSFTYNYVTQRPVAKKCRLMKPAGSLSHEGEHACENAVHTCLETCPDCGAFCLRNFGHAGLHSSSTHRNKEKCIYVAKKKDISIKHEEEMTGKTTRMLRAGESAKPEICDQCCTRKGRGHFHAIECRGGSSCLGVNQMDKARHSNESYLPDLDRRYDLVECKTYWTLKGWEPPVETKNKETQHEFSLCPYFCASAEHNELIYCQSKLFHTNSTAYKDHHFLGCAHKTSPDFDIVIILDCTGSMGESFSEVKAVITKVINERQNPVLSNKCAIVGYTDHYPDNGTFGSPTEPPVRIYPPSGQLNDFNLEEACKFLSSLRAEGGGRKLGEAMIDGMNAANKLIWRPKSNRMCFIIADESPHGDIFSLGTQYPEGCPCGLNWVTILETMKVNKTELRLVKLSATLNKTADLFQERYGQGFETITLESMRLSDSLFESIVKVIDHSLEFAIER